MIKHTNNPCFLSPGALGVAELPSALRKLARTVGGSAGARTFSAPVVAALASELIHSTVVLPDWARGASTRYLVVSDVADSVHPRLFSALDLRRPDLRVHLTRDPGAIRRLLVASARREPMFGIVDAYVWDGMLELVTGDFEFRSIPLDRIPLIVDLPRAERGRFEISADGSRLHWASGDIDLGVSQILQDADPMVLADVAIERNGQDHTGAALRRLREERDLRQTDIPGLSDRQVRRIEEGISRLRVETAEKFARAFGVELGFLLDEVGRYAGAIRRSRIATPQASEPPALDPPAERARA